MNDDELPTNAEMASAYLDGELDAAERAAAAADPDTMALVETFARVRGALGEDRPVFDSTRTAAIAAALAEFEPMHAAPRAAQAAMSAGRIVTWFRSRRLRTYRFLPGLAAAAVVIVIGIAALNNTRRDDTALTSKTAAPAADDAAAAELPAAQAPAATAQDTMAAASAETGALAADSGIAVIPVIDSPEALAAFAATFDASNSASPPASSTTAAARSSAPAEPPLASVYPLPSCIASDDIVLGAIVYQGVQAFAVRDAVDGTLQAIDAFDCHVLVPIAP